MEMSPDLARQRNNPVALSRAEESRLVMERTSQEAVSVGASGGGSGNGAMRDELRAMSQRLERAVRQQRETDDADGGAEAAAEGGRGQVPAEDEPMQILIEGEADRGLDDMQGELVSLYGTSSCSASWRVNAVKTANKISING